MDFLRDPIWQFVGVMIAVVTLYFSISIPLQQKNKKEVLYEIVSTSSLSSFKISSKIKMSILFAGRHLSDVSLVYLKLWNNGSAEIEPNDYIEPITFNFGTGVKILEAIVLDTEPKDIFEKVTIEQSTHKIIIHPLLLNSKDYVILKVLLDKFEGVINVNARIKGVKQVKNLTETDLPSSGYITSIGLGIKELLVSSPGFRYLLIAHALGILAAIIIINIFSLQNVEKFTAYFQLFLAPFAIGAFTYILAYIGLSKKKVRYNVWVLLGVSFIVPAILLALIIYGLFFAH